MVNDVLKLYVKRLHPHCPRAICFQAIFSAVVFHLLLCLDISSFVRELKKDISVAMSAKVVFVLCALQNEAINQNCNLFGIIDLKHITINFTINAK